jgi:hypothetical protein
MARMNGESDLASRKPSRQPSSQTGRHTAGVKRLELMACQPAGPIFHKSFRLGTRTSVLLQKYCIHRTAVCLTGLLSMS